MPAILDKRYGAVEVDDALRDAAEAVALALVAGGGVVGKDEV